MAHKRLFRKNDCGFQTRHALLFGHLFISHCMRRLPRWIVRLFQKLDWSIRWSKMEKLEIILRMIDEAFDHKSWHGTNLLGSVRRLDFNEASWRPQPDRHSISEIVIHVAYWKYAVRRRLLNEPRGSFALKGSNWFKRTDGSVNGARQWASDVSLLVSCHRSLREAITRRRPKQVNAAPVKGKVSTISILTGIAAHDLYHAGQVQLLKRLYANR
jgi:uncharacterized damage-inducible protein DinB